MLVNFDVLEDLYRRLNRRRYVHPDPLEFLYRYECPRDREIAALVASCLAYGRVKQILRSISAVLDEMGPRPARYLVGAGPVRLRRAFAGFRHRFATGQHLAALLLAARKLTDAYGSLGDCFAAAVTSQDQTVLPALKAFAAQLRAAADDGCGHLLPDPDRGSACKRLNLMLRWLVRQDEVDPGGWSGVPQAKLIVPLDVHMFRTARALGATGRNAADIRTALEVTAAFRQISPDDPVRYDFALTRLGIRADMDLSELLDRCNGGRRKICND